MYYDPRSPETIANVELLMSVVNSYYDRLLGYAPPAVPQPRAKPTSEAPLLVPCEHDTTYKTSEDLRDG